MQECSEAPKDTVSAEATLREMVAVKRAEAEQWLSDERHRLCSLESELTGHLDRLAEQLSAAQNAAAGLESPHGDALHLRAQELDARAEELKRQALALSGLHEELVKSQDRWHHRQERLADEHIALVEQLAATQLELEARHAAVRKAEDSLASAQHQLATAQHQVTEQASSTAVTAAELQEQHRLADEARRQLDEDRKELDRERIHTRRQRRRIALELKHRREELRQEFAALDSVGHAAQQAAADHEAASKLSAEVSETLAQLGTEIEALRGERDHLTKRLAAAEAAGASTTAGRTEQSDKIYELQRRFEMAVEDMRSYKSRVSELEEELAEREQRIAAVADTDNGALDWESQKRRLFSALDADFGGDDQASKTSRLTVEGAIRITDDVVAARDREIADLKRQLQAGVTSSTALAVSQRDAAVSDIVDRDAVVQEERERLRKLQQEVSEKRRAAEVELAIERAKFARDRVELEDRIHALQSAAGNAGDGQPGAGNSATPRNSTPAKPVRGRWLSRLGLKDSDEPS